MSDNPLIRWPENEQEHAPFARRFLRYDPQSGLLYWRVNKGRARSGALAGNRMSSGYIQIVLAQRNFRAHRLGWLIHYGQWPKGDIDHIDGDRANNVLSNLREVSAAENARNTRIRKDNKSGFTGVSWCKRDSKWTVRIMHPSTRVYLHVGRFVNIQEAINARIKASKELGYHENHGQPAGALKEWKGKQ